jgi:hypothetical protein
MGVLDGMLAIAMRLSSLSLRTSRRHPVRLTAEDMAMRMLLGIAVLAIRSAQLSSAVWSTPPGNSPVGSKTGLTLHTSSEAMVPRMLTLT